MDYSELTREQLIHELECLRGKVAKLEEYEHRLEHTEQALNESQLLLEQLSGHVKQFFFLRSRERYLYLGPAYKTIFGRPPEELHHDPNAFLKHIHPMDRDRVREAMARSTFQEGKSFDEEYRVILPDDSIRWVWSRSFPIKNPAGEVYRQVGFAEDITERKRVEEALKQSEEKFRLIFEFSPLGVFHFDEKGTITECNDKFVELIGSSREKLIGLNTVQDISNEQVIAAINEALSGRIGHYEGYYTSVTAGKTTLVKDEFAPIMSEEGAVLGGIGIVEDITERKLAEEALRKSEQLYRSVIENIEDVFYRSDSEGRLLMGSPSGARVFGYDNIDEMIGMSLESMWVDPTGREKLMDIIRKQGKVIDFEAVLKRKDGSEFVASLSTHFYRDENGEILGTEGIVRDITERKLIEAQLAQSQKMEAIGTLAGGVAHEVNNLLQIVLGHADMLLLREGLDAKLIKSAEAIRRAARNGADLVDRVLTFSRKSKSEMRPTNLSDEVRRVNELLRRTFPRTISIEMALDENASKIHADPSQIEQILLNLANNARDAMRDKGKLVFETENTMFDEEYCRIHPDVIPGRYVVLTVSDTGHGIERRVLDRIFEPFFTTKEPGEGTGLGLSMVFGIVKNHGGHVNCYSEPGIGTTFKIFFRVAEQHLSVNVADTIEMPAGGFETLLLVDDEEAVRTLEAEMLEMAGYKVLTAANGREALDVYSKRKNEISLVILDLMMPEMSGKECLEKLQNIDPKVRVLVASGHSANGPATEALESGAAGFIGKPFDLKQLLVAIKRVLALDAKQSVG